MDGSPTFDSYQLAAIGNAGIQVGTVIPHFANLDHVMSKVRTRLALI